MGRTLVRILTGIAFSAIAGGIALAFGLQRIVASLITGYPTAAIGITLVASGLTGLVSVGLIIASGLEDKLFDWISPRPRLGSLPYRDIIIEVDIGTGAVEIVITLTNQNPELLSFDATMRGRVNGSDWRDVAGSDVLRFPGFAAANGTPQLIMRFGGGVPFVPAAGHVAIAGTVDYEVIYRYQNRHRARLTAMTVEFNMNMPVAVGMLRVATPIRVFFRNHREE